VSKVPAVFDDPAMPVALEGLVLSHFAIPASTLANSFLLAVLEAFVSAVYDALLVIVVFEVPSIAERCIMLEASAVLAFAAVLLEAFAVAASTG
jgi:hypothetical protein